MRHLIPIIFLLFASSVFSQKLLMNNPSSENFPEIKVGLNVIDQYGKFMTGLEKKEFRIYENGVEIPASDFELICKEQTEFSVMLILDGSRTMTKDDDYVQGRRWDLARNAAIKFIEDIPMGDNSRIGTLVFNAVALEVTPFTDDKTKLIQDLMNWQTLGGSTDLNVAFFDPEIGAFKKFQDTPAYIKRVIIMITDGKHEVLYTPVKSQALINGLRENNITLYNIFYDLDFNNKFVDIANQTQGFSKTNPNGGTLDNSFKAIREDFIFSEFCYLKWISKQNCFHPTPGRLAKISFQRNDLKLHKYLSYEVPYQSSFHLSTELTELDFLSGSTVESFDLKANNSDFVIHGFDIAPEGFFEVDFGEGYIDQLTKPIIIRENNERNLKVRIKNPDNINFTSSYLRLDADPCIFTLPINAGRSYISITEPTDSSRLTVCDKVKLCWEGRYNDLPVDVYFSFQNGPWELMKKGVTSNCTNVPFFSSNVGDHRFKVSVKVDSMLKWSIIESSPYNESIKQLHLAENQTDLYAIGSFDTLFYGAPGLATYGLQDVFINHYDNIGRLIKTYHAGSPNIDTPVDITSDKLGNIYFAVDTRDEFRFNGKKLLFNSTFSNRCVLIRHNEEKGSTNYFAFNDNYYGNFYTRGEKVFRSQIDNQPVIYLLGTYKGTYYSNISGATLPSQSVETPFTAVFTSNLELMDIYIGHADLPVEEIRTPYMDYDFGNFVDWVDIGGQMKEGIGGNDFYISKSSVAIDIADTSITIYAGKPTLKYTYNSGAYPLGDCYIGGNCEHLLENIVLNDGEFPVTIEEISFEDMTSYHSEDFSYAADFTGTILQPGEYLSIPIIFSPSYYGMRRTKVVILGTCTDTLKFELRGNGICGGEAIDTVYLPPTMIGTTGEYRYDCIWKNITPDTNVSISPLTYGSNYDLFELAYAETPELPILRRTYKGNQCANLLIKFTPTETGTFATRIRYYENSPCQQSQTVLIARAVSTELFAEGFDWQDKRINGSYQGEIKIINFSNNPETIDNIELNLPELSSVFVIDKSNLPITIPANDSIEVQVTFNPTLETSYLAEALITSPNVADPISAILTGKGILPNLDHEWLCEGKTRVGESSIGYLTLINNSNSSDLKINRLLISDGSSEFIIDNVGDYENITLQRNSSIVIPISFTPEAGMPHTSNVTVFADNYDGTFLAEWKENLIAIDCPTYEIDPEVKNYDFGAVLLCDEITDMIEISNAKSSGDIIVTDYDFTGDSEITLSLDVPFTIKGGEVRLVPVTFAPQTTGDYKATLTLQTNMAGELIIELQGEGVLPTLYAAPTKIESLPGDIDMLSFYLDSPYFREGFIEEINLELSFHGKVTAPVFDSFSSDFGNKENESWQWLDPITLDIGKILISGQGTVALPFDGKLFDLDFGSFFDKEKISQIVGTLKLDCADAEFALSTIIVNEICNDDGNLVIFSGEEFYLDTPVPNPAEGEFSLRYGIGLDDISTKIELYDTQGKIVKTLLSAKMKSGEYEMNYSTDDLSAGVYTLRIAAGPFSDVRQLLIVR